jgi:K+-sensing histidine kinase KdpD/CheY-like chemotaxis protein
VVARLLIEMRPGPWLARTAPIRYGLAVLAVAVLVALKAKLVPHLGHEAPFLMGVVPALVATWYGGRGPGLVAAALSTAAVSFFFVEPREAGETALTLTLRMLLFVGENVAVVALVGSFQTSRAVTERTAARIHSSYDLSAACGRARTAHEVAEPVLSAVVSTLGASGCAVFLASEADRKLRLFAYRMPPPLTKLIPLYAETRLDSRAGIAFVARTRTAVFFENEAQWQKQIPEAFAELRKHVQVPAALCVPMVVRDVLVGVLVAGFATRRRLNPDDRAWTQSLAHDCGRALDRIRLLETERRTCIAAQEASRAKDDFLAVVSDELRAPLSSIAAWTHALRGRGRDRELCDTAAEAIDRSVQAQGRLIDGLLDQSRTVARDLGVAKTRVDLAPLVQSSVEPLRVDAATVGVDMALTAHNDAEVVGDADRLRQVMREFVSNAIASTPPGGTVRVDVGVHEHRAIVRIRSESPGGPAANGRRDQGGGGASSDAESGENAALVIARYLIECQGGTVRLEDAAPGRFAAVSIELPLPDPMSGVIGMISASRPAESAAPLRLTGAHVFLVSDDDSEREIIAEVVTREGAEVWASSSTADALEQLRALSPDVIVADLVGSERSALGFIRQVRALPSSAASAPALAYTVSTSSADVRAVIDAGYQRHLPRPPEPRALAQVVAELRAPADHSPSAPVT